MNTAVWLEKVFLVKDPYTYKDSSSEVSQFNENKWVYTWMLPIVLPSRIQEFIYYLFIYLKLQFRHKAHTLMLVTHSQEVCTRNLRKFLVQEIWIKFWCSILYKKKPIQESMTHSQVSRTSRLVQVSYTRFLTVCHRHKRRLLLAVRNVTPMGAHSAPQTPELVLWGSYLGYF